MSIHNMKVAGIDTGKACLHVCLLPDNTGFTVANDAEGHATLVAKCREAGIVRAGIEATSIYHRPAVLALRAAGIEVAELQPRQARAYAQALLQWAKNDVIDAFVIARLTQALAEVRAAPDQAIAALAEALTYIEQLEERIVWLKTSIERFISARFTARIQADIKALEKRRKVELRKLEATLRKDEKQSRRLDLLLGIPGIAERTALGFLIRMPELGSLSREQAARLAGLAPLDDDSGKHSGERHIYGGRARLRKTAFMAAFAAALNWNEDLKTFYQRLRQHGKAHTKAVTACARKLIVFANTVLTRETPWKTDRGMPCRAQ
jgi:transposase